MPAVNSGRRVLLAGGTGFIGTAVARVLEREAIGFECVGRRCGIDLCDWNAVRSISQCDAIVHVAGRVPGQALWVSPDVFYRENLLITLNLLELARLHNARIVLGSSYVYGNPQYLPIDEEHPTNPSNPYTLSKLMAEELSAAYARDFDMTVVVLRIFNAYGPGQSGAFLVPEIVAGIERGALVLRDSEPRRDFVHVADVAESVIRALRFHRPGFSVFNIGSGTSTSVGELVTLARSLSGRKCSVRYTGEHKRGEIGDIVADVGRAARLLAWTPRTTLEEGMARLLRKTQKVEPSETGDIGI